METPLSYGALSDLLLDALRSVVDGKSATYVAGPLATGRLYYDELVAGTLSAENVRRSNESAMREFVRTLRARAARPVIDSGVLRVSHWSPGEHGAFFLRVVAELCRDAVFMDGWEFSSGATKEFVFAQEQGIRCLDSAEKAISREQGHQFIQAAMQTVRQAGGDPHVFERRLAALATLSS
jgi:hypothetical protein